jgi:hypothetical protein
LIKKPRNEVKFCLFSRRYKKVIDSQETPSRELAFSFYILWICSHTHAMRQRKVLDDNEWAGWLQWMRNCFRKGTIKETWKRVEQDRWFNPAFQDFVNTEIVGNLRT